MVGLSGLEPPTSRLSGVRSNQLSYRPLMERVMGIEPTTSAWKAEVLPLNYTRIVGGGTRIRTGGKGFADLCLTTWLCRHLKSGRRDSNPRPPPWQGGVLPLNYFRVLAGLAGFEPAHHGVKVRCLTAWL
jgi:hypothetical protein